MIKVALLRMIEYDLFFPCGLRYYERIILQ